MSNMKLLVLSFLLFPFFLSLLLLPLFLILKLVCSLMLLHALQCPCIGILLGANTQQRYHNESMEELSVL